MTVGISLPPGSLSEPYDFVEVRPLINSCSTMLGGPNGSPSDHQEFQVYGCAETNTIDLWIGLDNLDQIRARASNGERLSRQSADDGS